MLISMWIRQLICRSKALASCSRLWMLVAGDEVNHLFEVEQAGI